MVSPVQEPVEATAATPGSPQPEFAPAVQSEAAENDAPETNVGDNERIVSIVAGSALALLGLSRRTATGLLVAAVGGGLIYRGVTGHCAVYTALGYDTANEGESAEDKIAKNGFHIEQALLINRSPEELYTFWRNFENLPQFMTHLDRVETRPDNHSHWVARLSQKYGGTIEWDAEITRDEPNSLIAWHSLPGSDVDVTGQVAFSKALGDRGTEVHVTMDLVPPASGIASAFPGLFTGATRRLIREDLRRFKQLMEVGEIATVEGQPHGTCTGSGTYYHE